MPQPTKRKLLLVGWDSADWKIIQPLIDSGAMPGIGQVVEERASTAVNAAGRQRRLRADETPARPLR